MDPDNGISHYPSITVSQYLSIPAPLAFSRLHEGERKVEEGEEDQKEEDEGDEEEEEGERKIHSHSLIT